MLGDRRLRVLVDSPAAMDVFPGVEIKAGVCYFLWDSTYNGNCNVTTIRAGQSLGPTPRNLSEFDVFVRDGRAVSIIKKVLAHKEQSINRILTRDTPFGFASNFTGRKGNLKSEDVPLYFINKMKRGVGYVSREAVTKNTHLLDTWKVLVPKAYNGGDALPHQIVGKQLIAPAPSVCTQSFLAFCTDTEDAAYSIQSYYVTRLFRFLVSQRKITQDALHSTYTWVPQQKWDRVWTDQMLYKKYDITPDEIDFIESMIRPMDGAA